MNKRIVIEVQPALHSLIKSAAASESISIREYAIRAILAQINDTIPLEVPALPYPKTTNFSVF